MGAQHSMYSRHTREACDDQLERRINRSDTFQSPVLRNDTPVALPQKEIEQKEISNNRGMSYLCVFRWWCICHGIKPPLHFTAPIRCLDAGLAWSLVPWTAGAVGARHREWLLIGFLTLRWVFSYSVGCTCRVNLCSCMCPGALWVATPTSFGINTRVCGTLGSDLDPVLFWPRDQADRSQSSPAAHCRIPPA